MSDTVIRVENLGKKYTIGQQQGERYTALRDVIANGTKGIAGRFRGGKGKKQDSTSEDFWALKDVSFEIKQGDRVGIIGRNGAGKSTLLKVLSRITEPTTGSIRIKGRVASLLEVGTGFHPELTGRENIYLNGAILGMGRDEIKRKFDEIVDFAEIEKFLDTPVKRYSSGMYVRLAFAVAAHLEPEILIVDEVLAVGDTAFQKKCLGKMEDVGKEGRTVLFVSHSMSAIHTLCSEAILMEKGQVLVQGGVQKAIDTYLESNIDEISNHTVYFQRPLDAPLWIETAVLLHNDRPGTEILIGNRVAIKVKFKSLIPLHDPKIGFVFSSINGERILNANNRYQAFRKFLNPVCEGEILCNLGEVPLMEGRYSISLFLGDERTDYHRIDNAFIFHVLGRDIWGKGQLPPNNASLLWWPTKFEAASY